MNAHGWWHGVIHPHKAAGSVMFVAFHKDECGWLHGLSIVMQMARGRHQARGWHKARGMESVLLTPLLMLMVTKKVQCPLCHAVLLKCSAALCPLTSLLLLAFFSRLDGE